MADNADALQELADEHREVVLPFSVSTSSLRAPVDDTEPDEKPKATRKRKADDEAAVDEKY